jgi:hypothetical protein
MLNDAAKIYHRRDQDSNMGYLKASAVWTEKVGYLSLRNLVFSVIMKTSMFAIESARKGF